MAGRRVVVTGGVTGIGRATVMACAREGAAVVSLSTAAPDRRRVTGLAESIEALGNGARYRHVQADIADRQAVDSAIDEAAAFMGGVDGLVNSAATQTLKPAESFTTDDIMADLAVNMFGAVYANQAAFRHMKEAGGSIVNVTSAVAINGQENMGGYGLAKGAVNGWSRVIAKEWGKWLIRVNLVAPVVASTGFQAWYDQQTPEQQRVSDEQRARNIALAGRMASPSDAANVNLFLLSDLSKHITGQTLYVDGGITFGR